MTVAVRRAGCAVSRLPDIDFSRGRAAWWLALAFLLTRIPLLGGGYGADTDAYRVVLSGLHLWEEGEYLPSRLPGFPLHDGLTALLLWGGPWLTNLSTALVALGGVLVFARLAQVLGVPAPGLTVLGFAFTPYLAVTSTATYDYHFALTLVLACYLAAVRRRPILAGVLLGIAAGFRITSLVFLVPLALLLVAERRPRDLVPAVLAALAVAAVCLLPVAIPYRLRLLTFADSRVSPDGVIRVTGQWALGAAGSLAVVVALIASWRRVAALPARLNREPHIGVWLLAVAVWTAAFLRLPVDLGYLVPLYPFGFLLLAVTLSRRMFVAVLAAIAIAGFVDLDIQQLHNFDPRIAARTVRPSWRVAGIPHDQIARRRWQRYARALPDAPVPPHSAVLTQGAFPDVAVLSWGRLEYAIVKRDRRAISMLSDNGSLTDRDRGVIYLAVSEPEVLARLRAAGYSVYRAEPADKRWSTVLLTPLP